MGKRTKIFPAVMVLLLVVLAAWVIWGNTALVLNEYTISSQKLPPAFSGFRIAQVSDLHNTQIGKNNENLLEMLRNAKPDMIAITGDLIDSRNTDLSVALDFVAQAVKIAPCYYVSGNHEARVSEYPALKAELCRLGVTVLENQSLSITSNGDSITLIGVNDPSFETDYLLGDAQSLMDSTLQALAPQAESFTILLSHRPELFSVYAKNEIDLIFSGHAHGGQFRLPFIGGLFAPNQGFFPEYDAGSYIDGNTQMIVSRGLGNSLFPFRFNNRPEVILIELHSA